MAGDEEVLEPSDIDALVGAVQEPATEPSAASRQLSSPKFPDMDVQPYQLDEIAPGESARAETGDVSLILDVDLNVRVELGRARMYIEDVLKLREGSIVPLDKLAGDPVDIYVNGRLMGRGEVLVLNDNFCVRVSEVLGEQSETASAEE